MGLIYRCPHCTEPMVLESFHSGRDVPCPTCAKALPVPSHLEFERITGATLRDAAAARILLSASVAFLFLPFFPVSAYLWWHTSGRIHKAEEDEREVDPLLRLARGIARVGTVLGVLLVLWAAPRIISGW